MTRRPLANALTGRRVAGNAGGPAGRPARAGGRSPPDSARSSSRCRAPSSTATATKRKSIPPRSSGISPAPVGAARPARPWPDPVSHPSSRRAVAPRRSTGRSSQRRIDQVHRPYHERSPTALMQCSRVSAKRCCSIAIRCRRAPDRPKSSSATGTGASAASWLSADAARIARTAGFTVALNDPYAGGAIVARHGRPTRGRPRAPAGN